MDPDAALTELRQLLQRYLHEDLDPSLHPAHPDQPQFTDDDIERAFELMEALDDWLSQGGFLPGRWLHDESVHEAALSALGIDRSEHRNRVARILQRQLEVRLRAMAATEGFRCRPTPAE